MANKTVEKIIAEQSVEVAIDSIRPYGKNPRIGNTAAIADSLAQNGQFRPIVVNKATGEILAGNHTWKAAKSLGWNRINIVYVDVDEEKAKRIVLADNRTNDLSTYNAEVLSDILSSLPNPDVGTGYDSTAVAALLEGMAERNQEAIDDVLRPPALTNPLLDDGEIGPEGDNSVRGPVGGPTEFDDDLDESSLVDPRGEDTETLDDQLGELQGILQLKEDMDFRSNNYYGIPDLAKTGLATSLPTPFDTWAGEDATPDDGVTTWLWNYGVASKRGLPMDRAVLCFYTYDTYFESFWENPAFMTAKMLNAGIKTAVVPDFSFYTEMACATWVFNVYRAQWLGRYFQEAGIKVIPRIQFAIDKIDSASLDFNTMGIPKGSPVVAKSAHNANTKEEFDLEVYGLQKSLEKVQPQTLLIYGGKPALRIIEALDPVAKGLCQDVVHLFNYAHKRRGVVFDKKEGLAARNKDQRRKARDVTAAPAGTKVPPKKIEDADED